MKFIIVLILFLQIEKRCIESASIQNYIINGENATLTPHHVYIEFFNEAGAGFFGGGSLITTEHILTSAQIVSNFIRFRIGYGSARFNELQWIESTNRVIHPNYDSTTRDNDIAIITLPNPLPISARVQPIALPPDGVSLPFENEQGIVSGFGFSIDGGSRTDNLRMSYKRVIADTLCLQSFLLSVPNHFCAADIRFPTNICLGDIGGGFTTVYRNQLILVGINSLLIEACATNFPSAYTRVGQYISWIQTVIPGIN